LTVVTLDGKVLWQSGRPNARNGPLTNDTPFQIHYIDGDGKNEVLVRDFQSQILNGRTGEVRKWAWMPKMPAADNTHPYDLGSCDSIAFVNFSGNKDRHEILVKDPTRTFGSSTTSWSCGRAPGKQGTTLIQSTLMAMAVTRWLSATRSGTTTANNS
jgi:hypothetical protein